MAHSQRGWTGARTPSAIKRVRQTERRRLINQPRRTTAKTLIAKAMTAVTDASHNGGSTDDAREAVQLAVSALDRAAKVGAIHRNAADRRKSRLMLKVNASLGGEGLSAAAKSARQTSKAQAAKQAKARIAAGRATKAKGAQTAAGKARAALAKTSRDTAAEKTATSTTDTKTASRPTAKTATKTPSSKTTASKSTGKTTSSKTAPKTAKATSGKVAKKS